MRVYDTARKKDGGLRISEKQATLWAVLQLPISKINGFFSKKGLSNLEDVFVLVNRGVNKELHQSHCAYTMIIVLILKIDHVLA